MVGPTFDPRLAIHGQEYSPTHIPDVVVLYHSNDGKHLLGDTKVINPFTSRFKTQERVARAAAVAVANTGESMKELVIGRKAISKPPGTNKRLPARSMREVK